MKKICIIGCGTAGAVSAALLARIGYDVTVVAKARAHLALEGMSTRAADGLKAAGFQCALDAAGKLAHRFSCWHGRVESANGEYLIEKQSLERALQDDLSGAGVALIQGAVLRYARDETGWRINVSDNSGRQQQFNADYLITACGRTGGENIGALSGPVSVMLSQSYSARLGNAPFTFIEPFEDGWAWATWDGIGHASLHVTLASALLSSADCKHLFTASCRKLKEIQKMIGSRAVAVSAVSARGSRPFLKGTIADAAHLKVGDAAYTVDPMSGHGMYEAISGAYAAVPVIHTLLERPEHAGLALQFYTRRAQSLFVQRMKSGIELYASEQRWAGNRFWVERSRTMSAQHDILLALPDEPCFMKRPVVEHGWIVEREVLLSKSHPQGMRFMDGIDLAQLYRLLNTYQAPAMHQLSAVLKAPPRQVASALHTLLQEGVVADVSMR
ncbi:MAG: hypothetical protein HHJ09_11920 [Glaciimonas sp.]|nr:hypothetical protein [Glaciimonas sp.]